MILPPRDCPICGDSFTTRQPSQQTCGRDCAIERKRLLVLARVRRERFIAATEGMTMHVAPAARSPNRIRDALAETREAIARLAEDARNARRSA